MRTMFSQQEKTGNEKEPNEYPLRFCKMSLGVVLMAGVHVRALL
jgi:hypothetical protein